MSWGREVMRVMTARQPGRQGQVVVRCAKPGVFVDEEDEIKKQVGWVLVCCGGDGGGRCEVVVMERRENRVVVGGRPRVARSEKAENGHVEKLSAPHGPGPFYDGRNRERRRCARFAYIEGKLTQAAHDCSG